MNWENFVANFASLSIFAGVVAVLLVGLVYWANTNSKISFTKSRLPDVGRPGDPSGFIMSSCRAPPEPIELPSRLPSFNQPKPGPVLVVRGVPADPVPVYPTEDEPITLEVDNSLGDPNQDNRDHTFRPGPATGSVELVHCPEHGDVGIIAIGKSVVCPGCRSRIPVPGKQKSA